MMLVSMAVHAIWVCEQPSGSSDTFPNHVRFSWLCNRVSWVSHRSNNIWIFYVMISLYIYTLHGNAFHSQVWSQSFWLMKHGAHSAKRTIMWSIRNDVLAPLARLSELFAFVLTFCGVGCPGQRTPDKERKNQEDQNPDYTCVPQGHHQQGSDLYLDSTEASI